MSFPNGSEKVSTSILVHSEEQCSPERNILSFWLNATSNRTSLIFPLPHSQWLASYEGYRNSTVSLVILCKFWKMPYSLLQQQFDIAGLLVHLGAVFWVVHGLKYMAVYFAASCTANCDNRNRRASIPFVGSKPLAMRNWKY